MHKILAPMRNAWIVALDRYSLPALIEVNRQAVVERDGLIYGKNLMVPVAPPVADV